MADQSSERSFKEGVRKRILIVDDDAELANLLAGFFTKAGFETKFTTKGKEAIDLYKELRPHLVLLDILLPDLIGYEVLKQMREPSWSDNSRFIMMSAIMKDRKTIHEVKDKHKAHDFIEKPFQVKELNRTIMGHLGLKMPKEEAVTPVKTTPVSAKAPVIPEPTVMLEEGDLSQTDLPRILFAFYTARATGVLRIGNNNIVKAIYFEAGKPIFAASQDPRDRLGEIMVRNGHLSQEQVESALKKCTEQNRIGATLVEMGLLSKTTLYSMIQLQVREIILSIFTWTTGRYAFNFEDLASRELIKLQTPVADLVLEGIRRSYSDQRLNDLLVSHGRVLAKTTNPQFLTQDLHLGTSESKIFSLIDGKRTVQHLIRDSHEAEINVLQLLYGLLAIKVIVDKI